MIIEDKRVFLRDFQVSDAVVLLKWGQNQRYHKLAGFEKILDMKSAIKVTKQYQERPNSYAVCLKKSGQIIGLIELYERGLDEESGLLETKEIGFMLDQAFEGHGYMSEALQLVLNYAFENLRQKEIWAGTFASNERSAKVLQRLGFKYVYSTDYAQISDIFTYQEKYYLLKRQDWLKIDQNTKF